jgi:hypothetical protein
MSRLPRPFIPFSVRVQVATRQIIERFGRRPLFVDKTPLKQKLAIMLDVLFEGKSELHHRPALLNRPWNTRKKDYDPPANDPGFLVYLADDTHDIETRVRGLHGQHSDLGLARKNKRIAKNRDPKKRKYNWPSRPFNRRTSDGR